MADVSADLYDGGSYRRIDAFVFFATCDWGYCDAEAEGVRWSEEWQNYLPVCAPCMRKPEDDHVRSR